ncbi:hypothetical protein D9M68_399030 [compost metagenome]
MIRKEGPLWQFGRGDYCFWVGLNIKFQYALVPFDIGNHITYRMQLPVIKRNAAIASEVAIDLQGIAGIYKTLLYSSFEILKSRVINM